MHDWFSTSIILALRATLNSSEEGGRSTVPVALPPFTKRLRIDSRVRSCDFKRDFLTGTDTIANDWKVVASDCVQASKMR